MIHLGKNTRSRIVSKGISAGLAQNTYRGLVRMHPKATGSRNFTQCDSLLIGEHLRGAHRALHRVQEQLRAGSSTRRPPRRSTRTSSSTAGSAAWTQEEAVALVVNGFCREVLQALPMEFAMEAQKLVAISLEGSVG